MKNKLILTDCDGVNLNWEYAFKIWIESKGHTPSVLDTGKLWNIKDQYGITDYEAMAYVEQFNDSAAIGFLPPLRDAMYYMKKLHEKHGYVFHCITSVSDDPSVAVLRKMNLEKLFGESAIEHVECLPLGSNKKEYLKKFEGTGCYWLEDNTQNALDGYDLGLQPLLMVHGFNMDDGVPFPKVRNWADAYDIITTGEISDSDYPYT